MAKMSIGLMGCSSAIRYWAMGWSLSWISKGNEMKAEELNTKIILANSPKLEEAEIRKQIGLIVYPGISTPSLDKMCSYVKNLLAWQKELVTCQVFELIAGRDAVKHPKKVD